MDAAFLTHLVLETPFAVVSDASDSDVDGFFQQRIGILFQKTEPDRIIPAPTIVNFYLAVKNFRHVVERNFIILTDIKPITFALGQKPDKCS